MHLPMYPNLQHAQQFKDLKNKLGGITCDHMHKIGRLKSSSMNLTQNFECKRSQTRMIQ
jgi:hypothetical protein